MASIKEQFRQYLAIRRKNLTHVQELILDTASALNAPFTPETLVTTLSTDAPNIRMSRATVFRTLQSLVESGLATTEQGQVGPFQQLRFGGTPPDHGPGSRLCAESHAGLISGKCPWCGRSIRDGKPC